MWKCKHCSEQLEDTFDACWSCGYTRDGSPPTEPIESEQTEDALGPAFEAPRGKPQKTRDAERATAIAKRYRDAYLEARAVVTFGSIVKGVGIVLALLLFIAAISDKGGLFFVIIAIVVGAVFYVLGLLISAGGQMTLATLDSAVNTSEFLTREQRAAVLNLP